MAACALTVRAGEPRVVGPAGSEAAAASLRFAELWTCGSVDASQEIQDLARSACLHGRVIHAKEDDDFLLLSSNRHKGVFYKKLSWVFGPDASSSFAGKDAIQVCDSLGMSKEWLEQKVRQGKKFKLVVFPVFAGDTFDCKPATWQNVATLVAKLFPEVAAKVERHLPAIQKASYEELSREAQAQDSTYDFSQINWAGREVDPRYMSLARLAEAEGTLVQVRQFLYDELGLANLFKGDGFGYSDSGERQAPEFLAENRRLEDIPGCVIVDLHFAAS